MCVIMSTPPQNRLNLGQSMYIHYKRKKNGKCVPFVYEEKAVNMRIELRCLCRRHRLVLACVMSENCPLTSNEKRKGSKTEIIGCLSSKPMQVKCPPINTKGEGFSPTQMSGFNTCKKLKLILIVTLISFTTSLS